MIEKKYFFEPTLVQDVLGNKDTLEEKLSVSTNTKILKKGEAFLAIKGEKHDGFKFVDQVVGKAPLIIFENSSQNLEKAKKIIQTHQDLVFIAVENSQKYTQTLAKIHCENWIKENNKKLIAISGSNGKTTTKEMLSFILNQLVPGKVISTFKNNNNHLGVPFTLFELDKKTIDLAVVEYGSNHPGEMKLLCNLSFPNMGVTTNIGETHMEFFKDTQAVFEEESEIYKRIEEVTQGKGFFLINNDDPYLKMLTPNQGSKTFGKNQDSDFVLSFDREKSLITINGKTSLQNSHILGEHNFINLAVAFLLADDVFPGRTGEIVKAASLFEPTSNRSQWREIGGCRIFLDAYNANPSSMRASIAEFITTAKQASSSDPRPLVILGDMMELGQNTLSYHEDLGRFAAGFPEVDFLYVGQWAENFMKGFKTENCQTFQNVQSAKTYVKEQITSRKSIFAKASRALQLESLFDIN
ncbi:MAG: UDP-N-acetylmuramoyl-tripeptide--D-alanyl-D-alanine ligase [Halobacteriovoraceae bacterium]|nr:UDP-N-acetylmuramoyl-tripeptide--D-alanyl-D-alanine ligase [Halobacteriovoraceae bacterium]